MINSYISPLNAGSQRRQGRSLKSRIMSGVWLGRLVRNKYYVPRNPDPWRPLAKIFKAKFKDAMRQAGLLDQIDPGVWKQEWVVDSQAVGKGQTTLRYLARYVFRVAISNNRVKSIENGRIKFAYKDRRKNRWKTMELDAMEFIRRFLQHVLPKGFMKIRHYGFLNPNSKLPIEKIRELISLVQKVVSDLLPEIPAYKKRRIKCSRCGHDLRFMMFLRVAPRWGPAG